MAELPYGWIIKPIKRNDDGSVQVDSKEIAPCRDCKYFDLTDGVVPWCRKWNGGSMVDPDGYCFLVEPKKV